MIKAILFDFDGTLINIDILTFVCELAGKEKESEQLHQAYLLGQKPNIVPLIERINFLKGITIKQIEEKIKNVTLTPGIKELTHYAKKQGIVTVINSGNLLPILNYFKRILGIDFVVGSNVQVKDNTIVGITEADFEQIDFKLAGVKKILAENSIEPHESLAIGDSLADKSIFDYVGAGRRIAINPKNGFEKEADFVIKDFTEVIPIIEKLNAKAWTKKS